MKPAAFEEKEYEAPLYNQLEAGCPYVWSPGQVFESHIGVDRGLLVHNPRFWKLLGRTAPAGAFLNRYNFDYMWQRRPRRALPNFRLNLFVQAKRPQHYPRSPKHIRVAGFKRGCWCFHVDQDQQAALERVAARLGARAVTVYASPAFHRLSELYAHTKRGTVMDNSTFPDVGQLTGHTKWFYNQPGGSGIANPDPKFSEGGTLMERIERLRESQSSTADRSVTEELTKLGSTIVSSLDELGLERNPRVAVYFEELRSMEREFTEFESIREPVRAFFQVAAFAQVFNLEWLTIS